MASKPDVMNTASACPQCGRTPEAREDLYTALVNIRNTEVSAYWTRYNIQAVLNAAVFAGGLAALKEPNPLPDIILLWLSAGGVILAALWLWFAVLGKRLFVDGWEEWIAEYEERWLAAQYGFPDVQPTPPSLDFHGPPFA